MTCEVGTGGDGVRFIACSRGSRRRCAYCSAWHDKLCDRKLGNGRTCDIPMCLAHSHHVAPDTDFCRKHVPATEFVEAK